MIGYYAIKAKAVRLYGDDAGQAVASACWDYAKRPVVSKGMARMLPKPDAMEWAWSVAGEKMTSRPDLAGKDKSYIRKTLKNAFADAAQRESGGRIAWRNRKRVKAYDEVELDERHPVMAAMSKERFDAEMEKLLAMVDGTPDYDEQFETLLDAFYACERERTGVRADMAGQHLRNGRSYSDIADEYGVGQQVVRDACDEMRKRYTDAFAPVWRARGFELPIRPAAGQR